MIFAQITSTYPLRASSYTSSQSSLQLGLLVAGNLLSSLAVRPIYFDRINDWVMLLSRLLGCNLPMGFKGGTIRQRPCVLLAIS